MKQKSQNMRKHTFLHVCLMKTAIATDKRGYQHIIFLISRRKHMLWVLIRSASVLLMSTHNICFRREIRKISAFFG